MPFIQSMQFRVSRNFAASPSTWFGGWQKGPTRDRIPGVKAMAVSISVTCFLHDGFANGLWDLGTNSPDSRGSNSVVAGSKKRHDNTCTQAILFSSAEAVTVKILYKASAHRRYRKSLGGFYSRFLQTPGISFLARSV